MSFCFSNLITEFPSDGNSVYKILGRKKNKIITQILIMNVMVLAVYVLI